MADVHTGTWLRPTKLELLAQWMGGQRWYAAKGASPVLTALAAWRLGDPAGEVGIETHIVLDTGGLEPVTYQVPLTYRGEPAPELEHALVGTMEHGVLGRRWVYDAAHDPVYATQLLALACGEVQAESSSHSDAPDERYTGEPASSWTRALTVRGSRVLVGEQSNTSVILDTVDETGTGCPIIIKIFRTLAAGANPDVVLQGALREAGCERVPAVVGSVSGSWPAARPEEGMAEQPELHGDLAFAQEFIPGSEDAWRVALRAAQEGSDFTSAARELGEATAAVHTALAEALPTQEATAQDITRITAVMRRRLRAASALVPDLASRSARIEAVFAAAEAAPWPPLQRIHGDYHLGQVLHSPARGWLLLDFEGEPLRPLAERSHPDSTFRDIAGMLRSLDYAGGSAEQERPEVSARDWVDNGATAFLDGYSGTAADPRGHDELLRAFLLDKALYEVVYEARNRPTWLPIPVAAITRLLGQSQENDEERDPTA
ncbi:MAG: phosphotransferase [Dermatophilaceae bacterium]|nr:phosphotransferase [Intrasporangiaceae bacterium]